MNELSCLLSIRAAVAIRSLPELFDALTALASYYVSRGKTQSAADLLAFLQLQPDLPEDTCLRVIEAWEDLETFICPRVLWDAREFASAATLNDIIEYVFAGTDHPA